MVSYEFETAVMDGVIHIPDEYKNKFRGKVKVVLMPEDVADNETGKKPAFPYFAVNTTDYVFDREEANEFILSTEEIK